MRTAQQVETEIDRIRSRMDSTLSELGDRMKPRALMRDGINYLSGFDASRYVVKWAGIARRNPTPAAIAGAILLGLFLARRHYTNRFANNILSRDDDLSDSRLLRALESVKETLRELRQTLAQTTGAAQTKLSGPTSRALERASDIAGSAGKTLRRVGANAQTIARDRPIIVGALALALAAGIAMSMLSVRRRVYRRPTPAW